MNAGNYLCYCCNHLTYQVSIFAASPKRAKLFHDQSLADEDIYEPFLRSFSFNLIVLKKERYYSPIDVSLLVTNLELKYLTRELATFY